MKHADQLNGSPSPNARFLISLANPLKVLAVNDDAETLLGFKPEDFASGKVTLQSRIHADDQDLAKHLFTNTDAPSSGSFTIRMRQANGRIRIVKLHYTKPPHDPSTGVKLTLLLQDVRSLYQVSGQMPMPVNFKSMMDNTDDFIFFKDQNHVLTGASQTLAAICPPAKHWTDLIGQTDYEIFPEEYADIFYRLEKQVYAGIPVANEIQEYQTKDGNKGWVDNRKYPIRDDNGEIIGLFGIARDITDHIRLDEELTRQAHMDYLTGLNNRGHFMELAEHELNRAVRYGAPLSLLMMDIDFFKQVNDTHGHKAGDAVLVQLAAVCQQALREVDIIGRMGGEEFAILLPETGKDEAAEVAERLRTALADVKVPLEISGKPLCFTVSIGLAALSSKANNINVLLSLADNALYEAKYSGRNRVCVVRQ